MKNLIVTSKWETPYRKSNKNGLNLKVSLEMESDKVETVKVKRTPVHIIYLIDSSGSMQQSVHGFHNGILFNHYAKNMNRCFGDFENNGFSNQSKLDKVKSAVVASIDLLSPEDRFTVLSFDNITQCIIENSYATPENKSIARGKISQIMASGGTGLFEGYTQALSYFEGNSSHKRRLFVLTDGETTDRVEFSKYYEIAEKISKEIKNTISVSTFGVGENFNEDFLLSLALKGDGNFYYLSEDISITEIFQKEVEDTIKDSFRNVQLKISGREFNNLELLNNFSKNKNECYDLPNIVQGKTVNFVLTGDAIGKKSAITITISCYDKENNSFVYSETINVDISSDFYKNSDVSDEVLKLKIAKISKESSIQSKMRNKQNAQKHIFEAMSLMNSITDEKMRATIASELERTKNSLDNNNFETASKTLLRSSYSSMYSRD